MERFLRAVLGKPSVTYDARKRSHLEEDTVPFNRTLAKVLRGALGRRGGFHLSWGTREGFSNYSPDCRACPFGSGHLGRTTGRPHRDSSSNKTREKRSTKTSNVKKGTARRGKYRPGTRSCALGTYFTPCRSTLPGKGANLRAPQTPNGRKSALVQRRKKKQGSIFQWKPKVPTNFLGGCRHG